MFKRNTLHRLVTLLHRALPRRAIIRRQLLLRRLRRSNTRLLQEATTSKLEGRYARQMGSPTTLGVFSLRHPNSNKQVRPGELYRDTTNREKGRSVQRGGGKNLHTRCDLRASIRHFSPLKGSTRGLLYLLTNTTRVKNYFHVNEVRRLFVLTTRHGIQGVRVIRRCKGHSIFVRRVDVQLSVLRQLEDQDVPSSKIQIRLYSLDYHVFRFYLKTVGRVYRQTMLLPNRKLGVVKSGLNRREHFLPTTPGLSRRTLKRAPNHSAN